MASGLASKGSDIDILVDFSTDDVSLFDLVDLKIYLESILKNKVDLVTRDSIRPWMISDIEKQAVRVS